MVNEMDRADFKMIADAEVQVEPAEIVAFYNAGEPATNPEFALLTTKSIVYRKDGAKTEFDLADVVEIKDDHAFEAAYFARKVARGLVVLVDTDPDAYHIEIRHRDGNRMRIAIRPELAGVSFFEALKSAMPAD